MFNKTQLYHFSQLIFILCGLSITSGCERGLRPLPNSIEIEVKRSIDNGFDGMIVYVNQGGQSAFYSGGWKNREELIPADPHALFKIGSISKLYIAAATAKLVHDRKLSLEEKLSDLLPEVKGRIQFAEIISLRMLLQHRSGIPDFLYDSEFINSDPQEDYMTTAGLIFDEKADFIPDKKYKYSNTNYLLIGEILDRTLGYSHHEFIKNEILIPLGLNNTYSLYSEVDSSKVMSGYFVGYEADLKTNDYTRPGGSMVASAEDVGIFLRALIDGTLLNAEEQEIYSSVYVYEHTGWLDGYTSIARYHKEIDAVVVQFVNTSSNEMYWLKLNRVYNRIVGIIEKNLK